MEAEANRFAAELLMPSEWVQNLAERAEHIVGLVTTIQRVADVSFEAAVIRALKYGKPGYILAKVENRVVTQSRRTKGTLSNPPADDTLLDAIDLPTATDLRITAHGDAEYHWWKVDNHVHPGDRPETPWRVILDTMLLLTPSEHQDDTKARVNAIIGNAVGRLPQGSPVDKIYGRVLAATRNRTGDNPFVRAVIEHPAFDSYVLARCYDRSGP